MSRLLFLFVKFILVIAGIVTIAYPFASRAYDEHQEKQLLEKWDTLQHHQTAKYTPKAVKNYTQLNKVFANHSQNEETQSEFNQGKIDAMLGVITIKKIALRLPVLQGATSENLDIAAGHIVGTAPIGGMGNAAIAGHRSYKYGRQFNRLDEIEVGDKFVITTRNQIYTYRVFEKFLVLPSNASVLKQTTETSIVTLITCHPMKDPTHRLIIQAKKVKEEAGTSDDFKN